MTPGRTRAISYSVALAALALLAFANLQAGPRLHIAVQVLLLTTAAAIPLAVGAPRSRRSLDLLPIALVLLLAFGVRWVALGEALRRHVDEHHSAAAVVQIWQQPDAPLLRPFAGVPAFTQTYTAGQAWGVDARGRNLAGLRLLSVYTGTLGVAAAYALARALAPHRATRRRFALLAALLLATLPVHLHFSRLALNNIADPLFGTLALALLAHALKKRPAPRRWIAAGATLGLTGYFYEGGRLLYPPLAAVFLLLAFWQADLASRRTLRRGAAWALLSFALVTGPVYLTLYDLRLPLAARLDRTTTTLVGTPPHEAVITVLERLPDALAMLFIKPDPGWFYGANEALVPPWLLPVALIGLLWACWRWRHSSLAGLLLAWLLATALGSALLNNLDAPRYVVVFPALALLIALGIDLLLRGLPRAASRSAMVGAMLLALVGPVHYFGGYLPGYIADFPQQTIIDDMRLRSRFLPDNTHVQVILRQPTFQIDEITYMQFVGRHADRVYVTFIRPELLDVMMLRSELTSRNVALFVAPDDDASQALIEGTWPGIMPQPSPYPDLPDQTLLLYFISRWR